VVTKEGAEMRKRSGSLAADQQTHTADQQTHAADQQTHAADQQTHAADQQTQAAEGLVSANICSNESPRSCRIGPPSALTVEICFPDLPGSS
jgi:hypothetical protein